MTIINDQEVLGRLESDLRPESLGALTRRVLADNLDVHENQELADLIFAATPTDLISTFYRQALTMTTPIINAGNRNAKPAEVLHEKPRSGKAQRPGWKSRAVADWYEKQRNARLGIPGGGQVPFRLCTIEQLESYADVVICSGQAQIDQGRRYARLAEIGQARGYKTGEDFPEDVLREVLT